MNVLEKALLFVHLVVGPANLVLLAVLARGLWAEATPTATPPPAPTPTP